MKATVNVFLAATLAFSFLVFSCGTKSGVLKDYPGYSVTESGLIYKIHNETQAEKKAAMGDFITAIGVFKVGDTTFFDSRDMGQEYSFPISESTHKGDIFEGLQLLGAGDSATFIIPADSLFLKTFRSPTLPPFADSGSMATIEMKILKVQTREEFEADQMAKYEQQQKENEMLQQQEAVERETYLNDNKITTKPTESGLIYIERLKGKGAKAMPGNRVKVHYTGTLLNGKVFDSSVDRGQPFEFVLGQGQVIRGWDEGIAMMNAGGKATLIIPSDIAYGSRAMGEDIPAFSTLVFEVELLEVMQQ